MTDQEAVAPDIPVLFEGSPVGNISVTQEGLSFRYAGDWLRSAVAFPVSLTMPLTETVIGPDRLEPWLVNLLAEGEMLQVIGRTLGIDTGDLPALLQAIGSDTAGALSFRLPPPGAALGYRVIARDADLKRIIDNLPAKPFLAGDEGVSMSLAGVQEKIPLALMEDGRLAVPVNGAASSHILKPDSNRLAGLVQNEAYCLRLARRLTLDACEVTTGRAVDRDYLLVTRYDRVATGRADIPWQRQHQEDFCQILGLPPARKYQHSGSGSGPGLVDFFDLLGRHSSVPARDRIRLLDAVIFNTLVGNTDAHAKNYSMIIAPGAAAALAPLYDIACAGVYDGITLNLAQDIADQTRSRHIHGRHWRRMAEAAGLSGTAVVNRVGTLARLLRNVVAEGRIRADVEALPAGNHWILDQVDPFIDAGCTTVLLNLDD